MDEITFDEFSEAVRNHFAKYGDTALFDYTYLVEGFQLYRNDQTKETPEIWLNRIEKQSLGEMKND
jgi:hypothetical protein